MTNPNDAIGTNGAYGGRTSVNALNDVLSAYSSGILSGWDCVPNSGLTVSLGGDGTTRDVAIAEDNIGNKTTINNISGSPVNITIDSAPVSNSRIDLIVAYVDNPPQGSDSVADNPSACGIIVVKGTAASTPIAPNDSAIRTAITSDGASGSNAYYAILAQITISSGTTTLTSSNITKGKNVNEANLLSRYLSITQMNSISPTISGGTIGNINDLRYALNSDGTLGKIYGRLRFTANTTGTVTLTLPISPLKVSSQFTINGACYYNTISGGDYAIINARDMVVNTNGTCTISWSGLSVGESVTIWLPPCLYFFTDFGDNN